MFDKPKTIYVDEVANLPERDVGLHNSIVRLHNSHIDAEKHDRSRFFRREAVVIINSKNKAKILRYVMGNPGTVSIPKSGAAIDYDAIDVLGIRYREAVELEIRRARTLEVYQWFWFHPDLSVRLSIRLGVIGAFLGVLGFFTGVISLI
ncbi:MAG: hypothetical protein G8D89_16335 [gamma proteobacterium symbiont of Clathrolucina costata]